MGTVARGRSFEPKSDMVVEEAIAINASVTDSSIGIWVGTNVPRNNGLSLHSRVRQCFSALKEGTLFGLSGTSSFQIAAVGIDEGRSNIVLSQLGTFNDEGLIALAIGDDFGNQPFDSHHIRTTITELLQIMRERAWAVVPP